MSLLERKTTNRLLEAWADDDAFVTAVAAELEGGRLTPKLAEKIILGFYLNPDKTKRKIRLGRW